MTDKIKNIKEKYNLGDDDFSKEMNRIGHLRKQNDIKQKYQADESMADFRKRLEKGASNKGKIDSANKKLDSLVTKYESLANDLISVQKQINTGYSELRNLGGDNFGLPGKMARIASKIKSSMER